MCSKKGLLWSLNNVNENVAILAGVLGVLPTIYHDQLQQAYQNINISIINIKENIAKDINTTIIISINVNVTIALNVTINTLISISAEVSKYLYRINIKNIINVNHTANAYYIQTLYFQGFWAVFWWWHDAGWWARRLCKWWTESENQFSKVSERWARWAGTQDKLQLLNFFVGHSTHIFTTDFDIKP